MTILSDLQKVFDQARAAKGSGLREACGEILRQYPLPDIDNLLIEIASHPFPHQNFGRADFGQPSVTLFTDGELALDLYYWKSSNISIHSHNFQGAFKLLHGKSFEQTYEFRDRKVLYPGISEGNLIPLERGTILPGEVRLIDSEDRFIHSIFHVESPSITLTLRTIGNPKPLSFYLFPSIEVENWKDRDVEMFKKVKILKGLPPEKYPAALQNLGDVEVTLIYLYSVEEDREHALSQALEKRLLSTPHGNKIVEASVSNLFFQKKYRSLFKSS